MVEQKEYRSNWRPRKEKPEAWLGSLQARQITANDAAWLNTEGYSPDAVSHARGRERVLARLDLASYGAQATAAWGAMIQAEVKIGEHLGMWSQQGRSDEVTLALVDALRQAVTGRAAPVELPKVIEHTEPTVNTRVREGTLPADAT